jgi:catalase
MPPAREFVANSYSHYKFVAYNDAARALFDKTGLPKKLDEGFVDLSASNSAEAFIKTCGKLRFWNRKEAA